MKHRILLTPEGTEGDIRPLLAIGIGLQAAGHSVKACVPPDFVEAFTSRGIAAYPMGMPVKEFIRLNAQAMAGQTVRTLKPMFAAFTGVLQDQLRALNEHGRNADLIVAGGLQFAANSFAEKHALPFIHAVHMPVVASSKAYPPPTTRHVNLPPFVNRLLWQLYYGAMDLLLSGPINRQRRELGLAPITGIENFYTRNMLLAMDEALASLPSDAKGFGHKQTGYWQLRDESPLGPAVERFITAGPTPVFIGFGSMGDPQPGRSIAIIRAALKKTGLRALLSSGWAQFAPDLSSEPDIVLAGHLPHASLFPRMAAVVHHGGAGTVHSAALAGVPQLIIPHMLDQYYWGNRVFQLGLGPRSIARAVITADRLTNALRQAVESVEYRKNAQRLSAILVRRYGVAEAVAQIQSLLGA
jgi:UDP:flavonoid glycosyltransferase YjiC (YdhE family)